MPRLPHSIKELRETIYQAVEDLLYNGNYLSYIDACEYVYNKFRRLHQKSGFKMETQKIFYEQFMNYRSRRNKKLIKTDKDTKPINDKYPLTYNPKDY